MALLQVELRCGERLHAIKLYYLENLDPVLESALKSTGYYEINRIVPPFSPEIMEQIRVDEVVRDICKNNEAFKPNDVVFFPAGKCIYYCIVIALNAWETHLYNHAK